jgi:hypothetical protein
MSLTDPVTQQDELDAIEGEFALHAERDARTHMEDWRIVLTYDRGLWRGVLVSTHSEPPFDPVLQGSWCTAREVAFREACELFDNKLEAEAARIYKEEYANG